MENTFVLKCGGSILNNLSEDFYQSILLMREQGWKIVIVHGGGPEITDLLTRMNVETEFSGGQRKTTPEVMEACEMALAGKVNKKLVRMLSEHGLPAVGLTGQDAGMLKAEFLNQEHLGLVGKVTQVEPELLRVLLDKGFIPVVAPLAAAENYQSLNVNADLAAAAVAKGLSANRLLFVTDVQGILKEEELLKEISPETIQEYIAAGIISGGMIPKTEAAVSTLSDQLKEVMIVSGKSSFFTNGEFIGTKICRQKEALSQ